MKKFLVFLIVLGTLLYFFLNPVAVHFLEKSLSHSMKSNVKISSLTLYPLKLDATIFYPTYPEGIKVHAKYAGGLSLKPRSIGKFIITSTSLGGLVTVDYEHYIYNVKVESADFKKIAKILNDQKNMVISGVVNGTIIYHRKPRTGSTDLKVTEVVLDIPDIDHTISSVTDALNLDVFHLFSRNVNKKKHTSDRTYVDHFQFNIDYKDHMITAKDVALRTDDYRISVVSNLHKQGDINYFYLHLLDKKACAAVTQKLTGNIRSPKRKTTTSIQTVTKVVEATPKSFFGMGRQMMQFGSRYAEKQTGFSGPNKKMTSYILKESDYVFRNASRMTLPTNCKVIYTGKVLHPTKNNTGKKSTDRRATPQKNNQKDLKKEPTSYRQNILL